MFDFFEGLIEKLGVRLVNNFTDKLIDFIENVKKDNNTDKNCTQIGASGNYTQIGASGNYTQIGASGNYTQIGASGDNTKIGASGYGTQIGASGDNTKIGASGNNTQIGASGDNTKIGASGYGTQIGASGDNTQIGASGNNTQIGASGDNTQIEINGNNTIAFASGYKSIIKAKKGTWISLAEYGRNTKNNNNMIPIYAKSAQIGNKEFKDFKGKTLKEDTYYILWDKEFYPVIKIDKILTIELEKKKRENITIIKAINLDDIYVKNKEDIETIYIAKEGKLAAHGYTVREAIEDLTYKKLDNIDIDKIIEEIKKTGKVTRSQYRAITGACQYGTNKFCEQHNIQELEEIDLEELRKILKDDYGAEKFWKLIDEE